MLILVLIWGLRAALRSARSPFLIWVTKSKFIRTPKQKLPLMMWPADSTKQEHKQSIDFLKTPEKFQRLGRRMPKGVLLEGPLGTGEILLGRCFRGRTIERLNLWTVCWRWRNVSACEWIAWPYSVDSWIGEIFLGNCHSPRKTQKARETLRAAKL